MTDGGQDFNLGHVVGDTGAKGDDGSTIWNTSTAPTYANSKYTFTISNLSGKTGLDIAVDDLIFYSTYYYIVSAVNSTTVDCTVRVNIKGTNGTNGTNGVGISSISKTGTSGKVDTYTINYTNSNTDTFTVTNGNDGTNGTNGTDGDDGDDGASIWYTNTAPTYANSKYTFTTSNLSGRTGLTPATGDIIFYDTYYYIISAVNTSTVDCTTRVSIKGANGTNGTNGTDGDDGASVWHTTTAPTYANTRYIFQVSTLSGRTGLTPAVGDIVFYDTYYYVLTNIDSSSAVSAAGCVSIKGATGSNGANGTNGTDGVGISSISKTGTSGLVDTYTITLSNGNTATFTVTNGEKGETGQTGATGNGISAISKTGTSGLVDTYTITFTNGNSTTFTVTNGSDATVTIDSSLSSSSTNPVQNKVINTALGNKVNTSDIVDNLTTDNASKVLSAKQGKALKDLIGNAISYINQ